MEHGYVFQDEEQNKSYFVRTLNGNICVFKDTPVGSKIVLSLSAQGAEELKTGLTEVIAYVNGEGISVQPSIEEKDQKIESLEEDIKKRCKEISDLTDLCEELRKEIVKLQQNAERDAKVSEDRRRALKDRYEYAKELLTRIDVLEYTIEALHAKRREDQGVS